MGGDVNEEDFERHYDSILDLIGSEDDGWFYYFDSSMTLKKFLKMVVQNNKE